MREYGRTQMLEHIINVRYLVGYLGEMSQNNWWQSSFYDTSIIRFLEPVFSRTASLAQYHGAVEAARRFHDENLSVGSFHIFRLQEEIEQDLPNHPLHRIVRALHFQRDRCLGASRGKAHDQSRCDGVGEGRRGNNTNFCVPKVANRTCRFLNAFQPGQSAANLFHQKLSLFSGRKSAAHSAEQFETQLFLQIHYEAADGGLRNAEHDGGFGHRTANHNGAKGVDLAKGNLHGLSRAGIGTVARP